MNTNRAVEMQFPCTFPIKAMGYADAGFGLRVVEIVRHHAPDVSEAAVQNRPSVGGKYLSVTVTIEAQSRVQLDAIYRNSPTASRYSSHFEWWVGVSLANLNRPCPCPTHN